MSNFSDFYSGLPPVTRAMLTMWLVFAVGLQFFGSWGIGRVRPGDPPPRARPRPGPGPGPPPRKPTTRRPSPPPQLLGWSVLVPPGVRSAAAPVLVPVFEMQFWRLFTNFFFAGTFQPQPFSFIFKCVFLYRYSKPIEGDVYRGRYADYLTMLLITMGGGLLLLVPFPWMYTAIYGSDLFLSCMVYLWARNFPDANVNVFGFFQVEAFYLPFVMLALTTVMSGAIPWADIAGTAMAHLYWFLTALYPARTGTYLVGTPRFMRVVASWMGEEAPVGPQGYRAFGGRGNRVD